jgi:hypothetical protein
MMDDSILRAHLHSSVSFIEDSVTADKFIDTKDWNEPLTDTELVEGMAICGFYSDDVLGLQGKMSSISLQGLFSRGNEP